MKFSVVEDYSLRCLTFLAREHGRKVTISRIAEAEGLSVENTAKVLARLREAGLLESYRGKDGGYSLTRHPREISIAAVLSSVGGVLFEQELCSGTSGGEGCIHHSDCGIRSVWSVLATVIHEVLKDVTLNDLIEPERSVARTLHLAASGIETRFARAARLPAAPEALR